MTESESEALHKRADHLCELASSLQEVREVLFEQVKVLRFNADLQWRSENKPVNAGREEEKCHNQSQTY